MKSMEEVAIASQKIDKMAKQYINSNRKQAYLLPPSIEEWLPKEHLARFIIEVTEQLDLCDIHKLTKIRLYISN